MILIYLKCLLLAETYILFALVFSPPILPVGEVLGTRAEVFCTKHTVYHKDGLEASTFPV